MQILLLEDEYPAAERLQRLLRQADPSAEVLAVLQSVAATRQWLASNPAPDLILSDIQLSDGLSFEIFEGLALRSPIIFTTAYDEYAIKAFRVRSIDYLLKPVKLADLQAALSKFHDLRPSFSPNESAQRLERLLDSLPLAGKPYKTRFLVSSGSQLLPLDVDQVAYFVTRHELTTIVAHDGRRFVLDYTLEQLERLLDPRQFFRANRQLLLHLSAVRRLHPYFNGKYKLDLHPEVSDEMLVSRGKASAFKAWLEGESSPVRTTS
ncbi:LytR/AlgR family response regulator transcription factor [Hymenobacter terrenus]|uniref:LytR/AlgR family response regulator transcription factor n=1 Tax=Hymenobacter terrenus TaxID=1629124 RepID=UPI000619C727|nr:LytTR family DNA-binding domain-containing protein [Hymenobacter terrenus]